MAVITFLIVAAGGSAYAAATIGSGNIKNNAVLSRHVKDREIKSPDLGANSVSTGKVTDGSLLKRDFKLGQLPDAAKSVDMQFPADGFEHDFASVNNVRGTVRCNPSGVFGVVVDLRNVVGGQRLLAFGTRAADDDSTAESFDDSANGGVIEQSGTSRARMDVTVQAPPGKWTHFYLWGVRGNSCNIHALIGPS
jgi:hypothetical protein